MLSLKFDSEYGIPLPSGLHCFWWVSCCSFGVSLYVTSCFLFLRWRFFSLPFNISVFQQQWCTWVCICLSLSHLEFIELLELYINVFHQIWIVFSQYVLEYLVCFFVTSPSDTPILYMLVHLMVSYIPLRLCSFFFFSSYFLYPSSVFFSFFFR